MKRVQMNFEKVLVDAESRQVIPSLLIQHVRENA
jgi:hypothetical protein